jgi:hypothetical protein
LAGLAVDADVPFGLLDEPVDHGEAEPGALSDILRREERLEDAHDVLAGRDIVELGHVALST